MIRLNKIIGKRLYVCYFIDNNKNIQQHFFVTSSRSNARKQLLLKGNIPYQIKTGPALSNRNWKKSELLMITRQLATMLQAGLPVLRSLQLITQDQNKLIWQYLLTNIEQAIIKGNTLSQAMADYPSVFSPLYQQMVRTGELTGKLDHCFFQLAQSQEKAINLKKRVTKALRYPFFVLSIALTLSIAILLFILPEFAKIYQTFNAELPFFTQALILFSQQLHNYIIFSLPTSILLGSIYLFKLHPQQYWKQREQYLLLKLPFLGKLMQLDNLSSIFNTLAITQNAGIPLLQGILAAKNAASLFCYQQSLQHINHRLNQGETISTSFLQCHYFPPICYQLLHIGEESGTLEAMLQKLADIYEQQTNELTENLSQILEPYLMLFLAIFISTIVIAIYLPILQLGNIMG